MLYGKAATWTMLVVRERIVSFEDAAPYVGMDNIDMRDAIARNLGNT